MAELSAQQLGTFQENGYIVLPAVIDDEEIRQMRAEANFILELIINSSLANKRKSGRLDIRELDDGSHTVRKIQPINDLSVFLAQISNDERLIGPMRQIMADEPILMEEKLNYKQPLITAIPGIDATRIDDRFPVHSDWAYYKAQNYPQDIISSAITMDECTAETGPLRVWPGSHKTHLEHDIIDNGLQVKPGLIDFDGGIDVLAPTGSIMLFHALIIHNSRPNVSGRPRRIMIYSHYPEKANMGFDVRNGPARFRESPYEWQYQRARMAGEYKNAFTAPEYN